MAEAIHKPLPGLPGVTPRVYEDPACQNAVPVLYYDIPCERAMALFPYQTYAAAQRTLRNLLNAKPTPAAQPAAKLAWCEQVSELLGTMNWATNVRLMDNAQAAHYIQLAYPLSAIKKQQQTELLYARITDSPSRLGPENAYLNGLMRADFRGRTGHELNSTSGGTRYSGIVVFPTDAFNADEDRSRALAHYALPGRQLVPYEHRLVLWKKCSSFKCKLKRALKKVSPIRSAEPGSSTARVQEIWRYVPSADETIRIYSIAIQDALGRRYASDIEAGYARWLRVYETYYMAGVVGTDPAELRRLSVELNRAKLASGAQTAAAMASIMPVIGTIAAAAMSIAAKVLRKHGAIGTSKIMCPPAPFLRSVANELCDTAKTLGVDPGDATSRAMMPVAFWTATTSSSATVASRGAPPPPAPTSGLSPTAKFLGALVLAGGAIYLLANRRR